MHVVEGAVIACAGIGSRLGMGLPKCMIEVGGQTVLSRLICSLRTKVKRIHVVVGYREEVITEYCARHHRDVVLVRNTEFRQTNTAHSLTLGSIGFSRKVLYLDGDLIIEEGSLERFLDQATHVDLLLGVTRAKSSQAVFVTTGTAADSTIRLEVRAFHREPKAEREWANLFVASPTLLRAGDRYVYECIEAHLPAPAHHVELFEIDTPEDLEEANAGISSFSGQR
jgi:choline kinase